MNKEMLSGERILWAGKPDPSKLLTIADIFLVPFGTIFLWIAVSNEYQVLIAVPEDILLAGYSLLINTGFVLLGFYFTFGRFIYKFLKRKNTYYSVTNKRILIQSDFIQKKAYSKLIKDLTVINKNVTKGNCGDIIFGKNDFGTTMYNNTGLDLFYSLNKTPNIPAFYNIENVDYVYKLIADLRNNTSKQL